MLGMLLIIGTGLALGYLLVLVCSLATTIGFASVAPGLVVRQHRLQSGYKLLHEAMWTVWSAGAGFVAAAIVGPSFLAWLTGAALAALLIFTLWTNTWEARQRGLPHQILISILSCAGVGVGIFLRLH